MNLFSISDLPRGRTKLHLVPLTVLPPPMVYVIYPHYKQTGRNIEIYYTVFPFYLQAPEAHSKALPVLKVSK